MLLIQSEAIDALKNHMDNICLEIKKELCELKTEIQGLKKDLGAKKRNASKKM